MYLSGFTDTGYELYEPQTHKTINSYNVVIHEFCQYWHDFPNKKYEMFCLIDDSATSLTPKDTSNLNMNLSTDERKWNTSNLRVTIPQIEFPSTSAKNSSDNRSDTDEIENPVDSLIADNVNQIQVNKLTLSTPGFKNFTTYSKLSEIKSIEPITYKDAMSSVYAETWKGPIEDKLKAIEENHVWDIVERTTNMKLIPLKWLFTICSDNRPKARIVAVGCRDPEQYSNVEMAAPTPSIAVIRWFFIVSVKKGWNLVQIDFKSAFLNGHIDRLKYVTVPEGLNVDWKQYACRLNKALYGLALAPRCWSVTLNDFLVNSSFIHSERESCIYTRKDQ